MPSAITDVIVPRSLQLLQFVLSNFIQTHTLLYDSCYFFTDYSPLLILTKFSLTHFFGIPHNTKLSKTLLVWLFPKGHNSQAKGYGSSTTGMIGGRAKKELLGFSMTAKKFHWEVTTIDRTRQLRCQLTQITNQQYGSLKYEITFKKQDIYKRIL